MALRRILALVLLLIACGAPAVREPGLPELYERASAAIQRGDLDAADADLRAGRAASQRAQDAVFAWAFLVLEAEIFTARGRPDHALALLEASPAPPSAPEAVRARGLVVRGAARCRTAAGEGPPEAFAAAERDLEEAARLVGNGPPPMLALANLSTASCALTRGDPARAERAYRDVLAVARQHRLAVPLAHAAGGLGFIRMHQQHYDEAVDWLRRAEAEARAAGAPSARLSHLVNLGWAHYELGADDEAREVLLEAEPIARRTGRTRELAVVLQHLGNVSWRLGDLEEAARYGRRSLELATRVGNRVVAAEQVQNLAGIALARHRHDEAEQLTAQALEMKRALKAAAAEQYSLLAQCEIHEARAQDAPAERLCRRVAASPHATDEVRWLAHATLGAVLARRGRVGEAGRELERAIGLVERSRTRLQDRERRLTFLASVMRVYEQYVDHLVGAGRVVDALLASERGRARLLRERVGRAADAERKWTASSLRRLARDTQATILAYWLGPKASYAWVVSPEDVELHVLPPEAEIAKTVDAYQAAIERSRDPMADARSDGVELYRRLVPNAVRGAGQRVIVIPDGALHRLNFDALVVDANPPRYWIEDAHVSYAPALSLLAAAPPRASHAAGPALLLIGDPRPGEGHAALPAAAGEVAAIAALFDADHVAYLREQAQPDVYSRNAGRGFRYIHFAAHAVANAKSPLESAVILSPSGDEAYKLYARAISETPVAAELVTLSACRSAGARAYAGEGLVGLAWAFFSGGARNVVASLWNVEDASTGRLMEHFYARLRAGEAPDAALREAKLSLLAATGAHRKPYYWAPFVLYRSGRS